MTSSMTSLHNRTFFFVLVNHSMQILVNRRLHSFVLVSSSETMNYEIITKQVLSMVSPIVINRNESFMVDSEP